MPPADPDAEPTNDEYEFGGACIDAIEDYAPDVRVDEALQKFENEREKGAPPPDPRKIARENQKVFRTGPKGVKADYNEARLKVVAGRLKKEIHDRKIIKRGALGAPAPLATLDARAPPPKPVYERPSQADDSESDWDEDPEAERLVKETIKLHMEDLPTFGECRTLNAMNFDKEVDGENPNVTIIIHVYQDYLARCALMNDTLARMAEAWPHTKFMLGRTDHILPDFPDHGCPSFIVFRGGKQLHNIAEFMVEIGPDFTDVDVVRYFRQKGILPPAPGWDEGVDGDGNVDENGTLQSTKEPAADAEDSDGSLDL